MENIMGLIVGAFRIAATVVFGVYIYWRRSKTLLAIF